MTKQTLSVMVFHPGRQHALQTAEAFAKRNMLSAFCTSLYVANLQWLDTKWARKYIPTWVTDKVRRYGIRTLPPDKIIRYGALEIFERLVRRAGMMQFAGRIDELGNWSFGRSSCSVIARCKPDVVVCFNNCAEEIFAYAKSNGIFCILEQTIGDPNHYNKAMAEQASKFPEYYGKSPPPVSKAGLARQRREYLLADLIIVGGAYAKRTILDQRVDSGKIRVVEYGHGFDLTGLLERSRSNHIEFIFVGSISLRKGCHLLLEAMRELENLAVRLTLVGPLHLSLASIPGGIPSNVRFLGKLPPREVLFQLQRADCFVFPSLFEGSAIVLKEAIAAGLPIIQTEMAGAGCVPDVNGLYVTPDVDSIVAALRAFASDPVLRGRLKTAATASVKRSWASYHSELVDVVTEHYKSSPGAAP